MADRIPPGRVSVLFGLVVLAMAGGAGAAEIAGVQVRPKGRLLVDSVSQVASSSVTRDQRVDVVRVRQAFLGLDARLNDRVSVRFEGGAANNDAFVWDEFALEYRASPNLMFSAGNLKAAGLENLTSTKSISFLERGPFGDLVTDPFTSAFQVRANAGALVTTVALQGDTFNNLGLDFDGAAAPGARDRRAITARLAGAFPVRSDGRLHLGAWVRARDFGEDAARSYSARPGTSAGASGEWLGTGPLSRGDATAAIEAAWMSGPFWIQAEAAQVWVDRAPGAPPGEDPSFGAGYIFAGWNVNGEGRGYDSQRALVTAPKIRKPLSRGGAGSLDLLARYDFADLTDVRESAASPGGALSARRAGDYRGVTLGAVWRPEPGYRLVLNVSDARISYAPAQADVNVRLLQLRAQYEF